jgi:predicted nicotinamide N-methyase
MPRSPAQVRLAPPTGYHVKLETITGSGADLMLRSLLDRIQYHDPDGEAERAGIPPASWPLFGLLWPSGQVLAGVMATYELAGRRVLELGCGLALASLVVHRRGGDVTASDCHPLVADFLLDNLALNRLPAMKYSAAHWGRANPLLGRFDLIIGSDVLYDREQPDTLSHFIDRHSADAVEVLIVDPGRGNQNRFSHVMSALGYSHVTRQVRCLPDGVPFKGQLHRYLRNGLTPVAADPAC